MPDWLAFLVTIAAGAAAAFGYLAYQRAGQRGAGVEAASATLREEAERVRRIGEDQARGLRQEIGESVRGSQDATLALFRELSHGLNEQSRRSAEQLRDGLRSIETRLDAGIGKHGADYNLLRHEIAGEGHRLTEALLKSMMELRAAQAAEAEVLSRRLSEVRDLIRANAGTLNDGLREAVARLEPRAAGKAAEDDGAHREALGGTLARIEKQLTESLSHLGVQQFGRLEQLSQALKALGESHEKDQRALRETIDAAIETIRRDSADHLDQLKRLKQLEAENARLRVAVAELTLEKITLDRERS